VEFALKLRGLAVFLVFLMLFMCLCAAVFEVDFIAGETSTPVGGLILSDTIWLRANSPYNLTGNLAINKSVTLTVKLEPW
jgi:hypothetical protein